MILYEINEKHGLCRKYDILYNLMRVLNTTPCHGKQSRKRFGMVDIDIVVIDKYMTMHEKETDCHFYSAQSFLPTTLTMELHN